MTTAQSPAPAKAEDIFHPALPLDRIELSKTNPRKHLSTASIAELADSIRAHGIAQPILVRPHPRAEVEWYELVCGERRYRACLQVGLKTIPALERQLGDEAAIELQIIENVQREDVHELDEANGYQALIDHHNYTAQTLAAKIGKSKEYVYSRLKLAGAIPEIQKLFYARELTAGHVVQIARLPGVSQKVVLEKGLFETVRDGNETEDILVSVRDLEGFIKEHILTDLEKAPFDRADKALLAAAGSCLECPKKFGSTCQDRACYHQKVNAWIDREVKAGRAIAATTEWQKEKDHPYWFNLAQVNPGSCPHIQTAICIDGHWRGQMKPVCRKADCDLHHPKPKPPVPPREAKAASSFRERQDKAAVERTYRRALFQSIEKQIDRYYAAAPSNPLPIAKVPLAIVAARLVEHLNYELEKEVLKELKLTETRDIPWALKAFSEKQLAVFVLRTALRAEIFNVNDSAKDLSAGAESLHSAAAFYKVDAAKLRKQVLAQSDGKGKAQSSARGTKTADGGLYHALHSTAGAEQRWAKLQRSGASDSELKAAIGHEFGIAGSSSHPAWHSHKGGQNPRFWASISDAGKPTLQGQALIDKVRELLAIPEPAAKVQTLTKSKKAGKSR